MVTRKRLGLIFSYDEQWIGGTYYSINLIESFNALDENQRPEIVVFSNEKDFSRLMKEVKYPYLRYELLEENSRANWKIFFNKICFKILKRKLITKKYKGSLDALFLFQNCEFLESIPMKRRIYWIADFQDKRLPQFFSKDGLEQKDKKSKWISLNAHTLILSSQSVYDDWQYFYPGHKCNVHIVHFAVTHHPFSHIPIDELRQKYSIPITYFFAPNQFWAHKNHIVLIKAAEVLKKAGIPVVVAFSGKENDNRNPGYTENLKDYVRKNQLEDVVRFLGFLDRAEQLQLMKNARAIIQPSKFEGWSTVIEDAMAINQPVIASDIEVNREQLGDFGVYFQEDSYLELSNCILKLLEIKPVLNYNYSRRLKDFATNLIRLTGNA